MNENTRQVLERFHAARRELELELLAKFIQFEARWGVALSAVSVERVDVTTMQDTAPASALVDVNLTCQLGDRV